MKKGSSKKARMRNKIRQEEVALLLSTKPQPPEYVMEPRTKLLIERLTFKSVWGGFHKTVDKEHGYIYQARLLYWLEKNAPDSHTYMKTLTKQKENGQLNNTKTYIKVLEPNFE